MISVCIATYNGEKYIKEQLDSILCQLGSEDEIIVSDDGSTDSTLTIIESYKDDRISLYKNTFKNVVLNFEFVINKAKGDYIFLSDQDDVWHQDKVKFYLEEFIKRPNAHLISSDLQIIDKDGKFIGKDFYQKGFKSNFVENIASNNFIGCAMAFRNKALSYILPFPRNIAMHDWWIGECCTIYGEVAFIDKKLIFYRRHGNNVTKDGGGDFFSKINWRVHLVGSLMLRYFKIRLKKLNKA
ncbi:Glycosyl transferase [Flavobacterium daejeonense]|nr:Glycosyl transferase [Flavobacterium daejeonense]